MLSAKDLCFKCWIITLTSWLVALLVSLFSVAKADFASCPSHEIRVYAERDIYGGQLLIRNPRGGQWQRLCVQWNYEDEQLQDTNGPVRTAQVLCRQTGFRPNKASAVFHDYLRKLPQNASSDYMTILSLRCRGNESHTSECKLLYHELNISRLQFSDLRRNCFSGISCGDDRKLTVTLYPPDSSSQPIIFEINQTRGLFAAGILGATNFGRTGGVCSFQQSAENQARVSQVACRELGFRANASIQGVAIRAKYVRLSRVGTSSDDESEADSDDESEDYLDDEMEIGLYDESEIDCLTTTTQCGGWEPSITKCNHEWLFGAEPFVANIAEWYSHEISIACLKNKSDGPQLKTGEQLNNSSYSRFSVFVQYGLAWLPLVSSHDPHTCRTICDALHTEGPSTAVCQGHLINSSLIVGNNTYVASIYCHSNETDVNNCAHLIQRIDVTRTNVLNFKHVHAHCIPIRNENASNFALELFPITMQDEPREENEPEAGCIKVVLENGERLTAAALTSDDAQLLASLTCKRLYPSDERYASYITFDDLDVTRNRHIFDDSPSHFCLDASGFIGCHAGAKSGYDCAFQLFTTQSHFQASRRGLGIICAASKTSVDDHSGLGLVSYDSILVFSFGHVEAFVSIDGWNDRAAQVACRQRSSEITTHRAIRKSLTHTRANWHMTNVVCAGSESSLLECQHEWKAASLPQGSYVAGVSCGGNVANISFIPIGNLSNTGYPIMRTSLYLNSYNLYFCPMSARHFASQIQSASDIILCKAAGYTRTKNAERIMSPENKQPTLTGVRSEEPNMILNFVCNEKNIPLEQCSIDALSNLEGCRITGDIPPERLRPLALRCDVYEFGIMIRLTGGTTPYEGHVEVMYKGEWGAVCDDRFDVDASTVVCRQLFGPKSRGTPVPGSKFITRNEKFHLDEVRCSPTAMSLSECTHNVWGDHDCGPCEQIGVVCTQVDFIGQPIAKMVTHEGRPQLQCVADGRPTPSYQWFTTGIPLIVAGDSVNINCQGFDSVNYTCNAFNDAGEAFVQVMVDGKLFCSNHTTSNMRSVSFNTTGLIITGIMIVLLLLALMGTVWKNICLRNTLKEVRQSVGNERGKFSYKILSASPST